MVTANKNRLAVTYFLHNWASSWRAAWMAGAPPIQSDLGMTPVY